MNTIKTNTLTYLREKLQNKSELSADILELISHLTTSHSNSIQCYIPIKVMDSLLIPASIHDSIDILCSVQRHFWFSKLEGAGATGICILWVENWYADKQCMMHRDVSHKKIIPSKMATVPKLKNSIVVSRQLARKIKYIHIHILVIHVQKSQQIRIQVHRLKVKL